MLAPFRPPFPPKSDWCYSMDSWDCFGWNRTGILLSFSRNSKILHIEPALQHWHSLLLHAHTHGQLWVVAWLEALVYSSSCFQLGIFIDFSRKMTRNIFLASILFSALVVLTHPEAMVHTMAFTLLIWFFAGRINKESLMQHYLPWERSLFQAFGGCRLSCTLVWILSWQQLKQVVNLHIHFLPFLLTLTDEPLLTFVAVLGLIGFFVCIVNKNYFIPIWYFIPYLVDRRSAATYSMIPLSMMAGFALSDAILPVIARLEYTKKEVAQDNHFKAVWQRLSNSCRYLYARERYILVLNSRQHSH